MSEWLNVIERFGVSVCLLIATGFAAWKVSGWIGPRIDKVVDSHVGFVAKVGDQVERQTDCLIVLSKVQELHGGKIDEIHQKLIGG